MLKKILMTMTVMALAIAPVVAHHAFTAEFDADRPVRLIGSVTKVEWINPHAWMHIDVEDEQGEVNNWSIRTRCSERHDPPRLEQQFDSGRHGRHRRRLAGEERIERGERRARHVA